MTLSTTGPTQEQVEDTAPLIESETRFAVVMYGGISLAIYIQGVAQELYHMVRATARKKNDPSHYLHSKLDGTEIVYRRLGEQLKTKFVVDILSGTSAGGINAIFLAKALVNDRPMEFVKDFWTDEGDISGLLNDSASQLGLRGVAPRGETLGLLNSQRFYYKLLEALKRMGSEDEDFSSPYVEEMDLKITTTDIRGLNLPLQITNTNTVIEPRYRNVFQFVYRPKRGGETGPQRYRNDFFKKMDPFLAFAARCTASIPPAFEAMQLRDIAPILDSPAFREYRVDVHTEDWKRFYQDYANNGHDFTERSFGDGGYLDNKPFSYATDTLLRRRADVPVNRLLVYIEPSPEHPEDEALKTERPDMLQNVIAALLTLPRSETIREDLQRLKERNAVIRRIREMLSSVSYNVPPKSGRAKWRNSEEWASSYYLIKSQGTAGDSQSDVLKRYGQGYISYHQLLVESVLNNLSAAYARAIGWNEEGREERELHRLLHKWLDDLYSVKREKGKWSQNDILYRLDLSYRMRRIHFLQGVLDVFLRNLKTYFLKDGTEDAEHPTKKEEELANILQASGVKLKAPKGFVWDKNSIEDLSWLLINLKQKINETHDYMKVRAQALRDRGLVSGLGNATEQAGTPVPKELKEYANNLKKLKTWFDERSELLILIDKLPVDVDSMDKQALTECASALFVEPDAGKALLARLRRLTLNEKDHARLFELIRKVSDVDLVPLMEELSLTLATHPQEGPQSGYLYKTMKKVRADDAANGLRPPETAERKGNSNSKQLTRSQLLEQLQKKPRQDGQSLIVVGDIGKLAAYQMLYQQVQKCLAFYYQNFDFYDMLSYPITYGTDANEADEVEIIRVSPEEATEIIDERAKGVKKLAGTALANFGAFFKREWRENDILWGRLDAAEILINQVAGKDNSPRAMVQEALENILDKDYTPTLKKRWGRWIVNVEKFVRGTFPKGEGAKTLAALIESTQIKKDNVLEFFKNNFETDRQFPPETIDSAVRAATVTGNLLHDAFGNYRMLADWRKRVKNLSIWVAGLLFMAKDSPLTNSILGAFYVGSLLLLLAGIFISGFWEEALIGLVGLLLTAAVHVTAVKARIFLTRNVKGQVTFVYAYLLPFLWTVVVIAFWSLCAFLIYLGLEAIGLPRPGGMIGAWIQAASDWLNPLMRKLIGLFTAR